MHLAVPWIYMEKYMFKNQLVGMVSAILSVLLFSTVCVADTTDITNRIAPLGNVRIAEKSNPDDSATASTTRSGEAIYAAHCAICHKQGVAGAPKLGDKAAWEARVKTAQSREGSFLTTVKQGLNAMPPMGTCNTCSDVELQAAINYMLQH